MIERRRLKNVVIFIQATSWIIFSGHVKLPAEMAFSWFFSFTACLCQSVVTWSDKVEDLKFALSSIKVMFVQGISFSFFSCDLKIVQIIFLSPPESVTKSQGNFSFICWLLSLLGLFYSFQLNFIASSEKKKPILVSTTER